MSSYEIFQLAMDYRAPPGIIHPLLKERYNWVDEELEKREKLEKSYAMYKYMCPVPLKWFYNRDNYFYEALENNDIIEEYDYTNLNSIQVTFSDLYPYDFEPYDSDLSVESFSSMPSLVNLNDLNEFELSYPYTQSLLRIMDEDELSIQEIILDSYEKDSLYEDEDEEYEYDKDDEWLPYEEDKEFINE